MPTVIWYLALYTKSNCESFGTLFTIKAKPNILRNYWTNISLFNKTSAISVLLTHTFCRKCFASTKKHPRFSIENMATPLRLLATQKFQISPARKAKSCGNVICRIKTPLSHEKRVCVKNYRNFRAVKRLDFSDDANYSSLKIPEIKINGFYQHNKVIEKCVLLFFFATKFY